MPIFDYTAYKDGGKGFIKGKISASNPTEARENLRNMGLKPVDIVEEDRSKEIKGPKNKIATLKLSERINFTTTFQTLTQAGISIIEALIFIENDASKPSVRNVAKGLRSMIFSGYTIASALARYPEIFGKIYIGLTKAGEDSGEVEKTFNRIIDLLKKEQNIRSKVSNALMYPVFVIVLAMLALTIMLTFVFPQFKEIFENLGTSLPLPTKICINAGLILQKYWIIIPLGFLSIVGFIYALIKWKPLRYMADEFVLKIPLIGNLIRYSNFSNFIAVMQVAYDAGIPIVDSLYLAILTLDNNTLRIALNRATTQVQQGTHLSVALKATKVMPKNLTFMIATGEQSGKLGELLLNSVKMIDTMLDDVIDKMTKMIEPIMLLM